MNDIKEKEFTNMQYQVTSIIPILSDDEIKTEQDLENTLFERFCFTAIVRDKDCIGFVETYNLKNVGKTKALIKFAKEFNYDVIEPSSINIDYFKNTYDYDRIFLINEYNFNLENEFVIDEGIDIKSIHNKKLITGFINSINQYSNSKAFDYWTEQLIYFNIELQHKIITNSTTVNLKNKFNQSTIQAIKILNQSNPAKVNQIIDKYIKNNNKDIEKLQKKLNEINTEIIQSNQEKELLESYSDLLK